MRTHTLLAVLAIALAGSGCVNHQFTEAILFEQTGRASESFRPVGIRSPDGPGGLFSNNPIFIASNAKFSVEIDRIATSWIHQHLSDAVPNLDSAVVRERGIPRAARDHVFGRELWLLVTITSLDRTDPLETNSNHYFKATSIKYDVASQSFLPLDVSERVVFTHDADGPYRITFQLYDVEDIAFKKAIGDLRDEPGLADFLASVGTTLSRTVGGLAGSAISRRWSEYADEQLGLERLLVRAGAEEEFRGSITLYRKDDFESMYPGWLAFKQEYVLADILKACPKSPYKHKDYETLRKGIENATLTASGELSSNSIGTKDENLSPNCDSPRTPRIRLRVLQSPSPTLSDAMSTTVLSLSQADARLTSVDELIHRENKAVAQLLVDRKGPIDKVRASEGCIPGEARQPCQLIDWIYDAILAHQSIETAEKDIGKLRGNEAAPGPLARAAEIEITTRFERDRLDVLIGQVLDQLYETPNSWSPHREQAIQRVEELLGTFEVDSEAVANARYQRQQINKRREGLILLRRILSRSLD